MRYKQITYNELMTIIYNIRVSIVFFSYRNCFISVKFKLFFSVYLQLIRFAQLIFYVG